MIKLKKNIIVTLMGVDGAGKTTLSKKLHKMFKGSIYLHLKPYIFFQDRRTVIRDPHKEKKSTFIFSFLRLLSWLISYKIFFYQRKKNKIYIFDRYAHDVLIDPLRYKHDLYQGITKYILSFFPEPDLWVFLNPSIKTIKARKQELSNYELRRQINAYNIFFKTKKKVLKLNTIIQKEKLITRIRKSIIHIVK